MFIITISLNFRGDFLSSGLHTSRFSMGRTPLRVTCKYWLIKVPVTPRLNKSVLPKQLKRVTLNWNFTALVVLTWTQVLRNFYSDFNHNICGKRSAKITSNKMDTSLLQKKTGTTKVQELYLSLKWLGLCSAKLNIHTFTGGVTGLSSMKSLHWVRFFNVISCTLEVL